ncbi:MAG: hypothetical protein ACYS8L_09900, partial [Planctomycetota bacterium]
MIFGRGPDEDGGRAAAPSAGGATAPRRRLARKQKEKARPLRILHVLAVSVPYINGYTMRSKYVVDTQRAAGMDPVVVTSPFYPGNEAACEEGDINGTHYYRVPHPADTDGPLPLGRRVCGWLYVTRECLRTFRLLELARKLFGPTLGKATRPFRTGFGFVFRVAGVPLLPLRSAAAAVGSTALRVWSGF